MEGRISRSFLAVPGSNPTLFPKAARTDADQVFLDLEDAVTPANRDEARAHVVEGLHQVEWPSWMTRTVRVNPPSSPEIEDDIQAVVGGAAGVLHTILIPKVDEPEELAVVERLLRTVEADAGASGEIGIEVLIESAGAFTNLAAIATASDRLEALHFGAGDFAASMGARTIAIGALTETGTDPWHAVKVALVAAARANGLRCLDSAYDDFSDPDGYQAIARGAAAIGFDGKWAIHPSQVPIANAVFTPTSEEIERAQRIVEAMDEAEETGRGAAQLEGVMLDAASVRLARNTLELAARAARG